MDSLEKNGISASTAAEMTRRAFDAEPQKIEELRDGFLKSVFKIHLKTGGTVILKVAPPDKSPVMRHEKNSLESEVKALNKIIGFQHLPAPHVLFFDRSRNIIDSEYLFLENLEGVPFSELEGLRLSDSCELFNQAGIYAHKINSITEDYFGFLEDSARQFSSWSEAFFSMVDGMLLDAQDTNVTLPFEYDYIRDRISGEAQLLNHVQKPALIHGNLQKGNILIDKSLFEITGIIAFGHAVFADPLMEPVFGLLDKNNNFLCSYNSGRKFSNGKKLRMTLYKIYFALLGLTRCSFHRIPEESELLFFKSMLEQALDEYCMLKGENF